MLKQTKWLAVLLAAVLMLGSCAQVGGAVLAARVGMPAGAGEVAAQPEAAPRSVRACGGDASCGG